MFLKMNLKISKKFLFILTDYGSANIINSLIKKFKIKKFKIFFLSNNTKYIFKKYKKFFIKKICYSDYNTIVVGTGANPEKYYNLLKKFDSGARKYFLIDHWLGIEDRLNFNLLNKYKVNLLFTEISNIKKIKSKLKESKSYKIPNYYIKEVSKNFKKKKKYFYRYLYIDDLSSYIKNKKVRKKIYESAIKKFLHFLQNKNNKKIKVLIRPHPSDRNNKIKKLIKIYQNNKKFNVRSISFYFSKNKKDIMHDLNSSEIIVGSQSSALLLSKKIGKKTYTSLSPKYLKQFAKSSPYFKQIC
jgi:hypothetical protein